jgi:hypothetical protein
MNNNIQIDFEFLKNAYKIKGLFRLHPELLIFMYLVYLNEYDEADNWVKSCDGNLRTILQRLESASYIKIISEIPDKMCEEILDFKPEFTNLLPLSSNQGIESWIKEWVELWPSGVKAGSYYVKTSEKDILPRMNKFIKKYKFSKETIIAATKQYLAERKAQNWAYTTCADYFIFKDNVSRLAGYCTNLGTKSQDKTTDFSKEV